MSTGPLPRISQMDLSGQRRIEDRHQYLGLSADCRQPGMARCSCGWSAPAEGAETGGIAWATHLSRVVAP